MPKTNYRRNSLIRLILSGLCLLAGQAWGQITINGLVTDPKSVPLQGVSIVVKSTERGTTTDAAGRYSVVVPNESTVLIYSSLGFTTEEITVGSRRTVNIQLTADVKALSDVIVVGYGTLSRRSVTAAVASLNTKGLEDIPVTSGVSLLQGRVAGVNITQASGQPGSSVNVRIRGVSSVAGSEPLYIIDGVQIKSGNFSQYTDDGNPGNSGFSALSDINPNDIEDIQILKDASAAAIYGSRATNGVVIITTKRGKTGKGTISLNTSTGFGQPTNRLDLLSTAQLKEVIRNSYTHNGISPTLNTATTNGAWNGQGLHNDTMLSINYQNELLARRTAFSDMNLNFSGGTAGIKYALSAGYTNQEGSLINTGLKRYTSRLNAEAVLNDRVTAGASIGFTNSRIRTQDEDGNIQPLYRGLAFTAPTQKLYNPDGSFYNLIQNPVQAMREIKRYHISNRVIGRIYTNIEISKKLGIFFKPSFSTDALFFEENRFIPSTYLSNTNQRRTEVRNRTNVGIISENLLTFSRRFDKHNIDALIGYSYQREDDRVLQVAANGGSTDLIETINGASTINSFFGASSFWTLESQFAQANYNFNDRYLLSGTIRRDGSSRFGQGNRYGYFPSVSAGWRISDEAFMKNVSFVNDLKLRVSYGVTGSTQGLGAFQAQGIYDTRRNYERIAGIGISVNGLSNPNLSWETTYQSDIGIDLTLFNNRVNIVADYYLKQTKGILFNVLLPLESGFNSIADNVGEMQNKGWEFAITTNNINKPGFSWETNFNISRNRNKVTSLPSANGSYLINGNNPAQFFTILQEGYPINSYFLFASDGIYQTNQEAASSPVPPLADAGRPGVAGDLIWRNNVKDGVINIMDREIMGTPLPLFTGGLNNRITFKSFSFDFLFQFAWGNKLYNAFKQELNYKISGNHMTSDILDAWSPTNTDGKWPRVKWDDFRRNGHVFQSPADIYLEDGSYARLKAATFSYRLPVNVFKRIGMTGARVYVSGANLLTFTKYTGYDPESLNLSYTAIYAGVDRGNPPLQRTVSMGINLQF